MSYLVTFQLMLADGTVGKTSLKAKEMPDGARQDRMSRQLVDKSKGVIYDATVIDVREV